MDCMSYFFNPVTVYDAHASVKLQAGGNDQRPACHQTKQDLRISDKRKKHLSSNALGQD